VRQIAVLSPFSGRVVPLGQVPDPVFAARMLGDGLAVEPSVGVAVAPVDGELSVLHAAGHAFAIQANEEVSVLVHIGLDTVRMHGQGFVTLAHAGDRVRVGQELVRFDLGAIVAAGHSCLSPVILPDLPAQWRVEPTTLNAVRAGQTILLTVVTAD